MLTKDKNYHLLLSNIINLAGVGDKLQAALSRLKCSRVIDLLWHFPSNIIKKQFMPNLMYAADGTYIISKIIISDIDVQAKFRFGAKKQPFKITGYNDTGIIQLVYFNYYPDYLIKNLHIGLEQVVSGRIERYHNQITIAHPDYVVNTDKINDIPQLEVIYPLTYAVTSKQITKLIEKVIKLLPVFEEWIDISLVIEKKWLSFKDSIINCHHPNTEYCLLPSDKARERLAYDELLANQLGLNLIRSFRNKTLGTSIKCSGVYRAKLIERLGFNLTNGQLEVIAEIIADQESPFQMMRLLQGDVGSGKTVVALCAILNAVEHGSQACLMAPTDILASQHKEWIEKATTELPLRVELLTGKIKGKKRTQILKELAAGEIDILIGTHALFQENVVFKDLAFIVIDEQHRFGVEQRLALSQKGNNPDVLVMSATPIPRTLTLVLYGDMEISRLTEKPAGRTPILTSVMPVSKLEELILSIENKLNQNEKIYWICPLIEEQEKDDSDEFKKNLAAAIARYNSLQARFPDQVGLIHGKMKAMEKDQAMQDFAFGKTKILVATTVIEVGIDVKDATIIVIEQAERFGLSQLHQLRGRVGRGNKPSYCILLYGFPISDSGKARLKILKESEDGFKIAEEDMRLRGAGEILGTKQSGLPEFKIVDYIAHMHLFELARNNALTILATDPKLETTIGQRLRVLLQLFEYNEQIDYLKSG